MAPTTEAVLKKLREALPRLKERYPIESLQLVGSYARGEQTETSDVDLVVSFHGPVGLGFFHLAHELEELFSAPVDLVSVRSLKPSYERYIFSNAISVG